MTSICSTLTPPGNTPARIAYTYDGYSRRVLKREYRTIGGVEKTVEYVGFIYDGWNHVMTVRLNETNTPRGRVASYVWGPDVGSGYGEYAGHQKAGGVGGLCLVLDGAATDNSYPQNVTSPQDVADDDYFPLMEVLRSVNTLDVTVRLNDVQRALLPAGLRPVGDIGRRLSPVPLPAGRVPAPSPSPAPPPFSPGLVPAGN